MDAGGPDWRCVGFENSANHDAVSKHIEIVVVPLASWAACVVIISMMMTMMRITTPFGFAIAAQRLADDEIIAERSVFRSHS
jgi:hypothetical protein